MARFASCCGDSLQFRPWFENRQRLRVLWVRAMPWCEQLLWFSGGQLSSTLSETLSCEFSARSSVADAVLSLSLSLWLFFFFLSLSLSICPCPSLSLSFSSLSFSSLSLSLSSLSLSLSLSLFSLSLCLSICPICPIWLSLVGSFFLFFFLSLSLFDKMVRLPTNTHTVVTRLFVAPWQACFVTWKCSYRPRNPQNFKDTKKWLKSDCRGSCPSDVKVAQKWLEVSNGWKSPLESLPSNS